MKHNLVKKIAHLKPCQEAAEWLAQQQSFTQAWRDCQRGDWMLWLLVRTMTSPPRSPDRRTIVACALDCVQLSCPHIPVIIQKDVHIIRDWVQGAQQTEEIFMAICNRIFQTAIMVNAYADLVLFGGQYSECKAACHLAQQLANYAGVAAILFGYPTNDQLQMAAHISTIMFHQPWPYTARVALPDAADVIRRHFPRPPRINKPTRRRVHV